MPPKNTLDSGEPIVRTFHWIKWADSDYLAARCLLLGRMVVQGCVLANTAIEKYLKALHAHLELPIPVGRAVTERGYLLVRKEAPGQNCVSDRQQGSCKYLRRIPRQTTRHGGTKDTASRVVRHKRPLCSAVPKPGAGPCQIPATLYTAEEVLLTSRVWMVHHHNISRKPVFPGFSSALGKSDPLLLV
jgi:hypothetical protein